MRHASKITGSVLERPVDADASNQGSANEPCYRSAGTEKDCPNRETSKRPPSVQQRRRPYGSQIEGKGTSDRAGHKHDHRIEGIRLVATPPSGFDQRLRETKHRDHCTAIEQGCAPDHLMAGILEQVQEPILYGRRPFFLSASVFSRAVISHQCPRFLSGETLA